LYFRRYLPVLKDMPLRYVFEPWKAPKSVQEKANCIVGVDYPKPMVEHAKVTKQCYNMMMEVKNKLVATGEGMVTSVCKYLIKMPIHKCFSLLHLIQFENSIKCFCLSICIECI